MRKYLPHLVVLVTLFAAGYLALAQVRERGLTREPEPQETTNVPAQEVEEKAGISDTGVVVNFSKLASKESLSPYVYKEPKVIREPRRAPRNKTVPVEGALAESDKPEMAAAAVGGTKPFGPSPAPSSSFKALEDNNTSIPPDTHGAVGPNHLMVTLNTQLRIQTRAGATISTVSLDSFFAAVPGPWAAATPSTFDPQVFYDPFNNRWMLAVTADGDEPTSAILIAVSQTSDPTGNWKIYKADVDSAGAAWADYPRLGFNKNWIVVTVNMFGIADGDFKRSSIFVFNKATLYSFAASASYKVFQDVCGTNICAFTQTPAVTYDNTLNTLYLVEDWDGHTQLRISSLTGTAAAPAYSTSHPVTPPVTAANSWTFGPSGGDDFAPQLGSTNKLQTNDSRIQSVVYRNGSLWAAQTIFLPNAATPTRSSIQWWQLTPAGAIQQRGRVDDPTSVKFYAFPSIAVNKNNDVLIGYSRFSSQQYASANYSVRGAGDPLNTLRDEVVLKAGAAPYFKTFSGTRNRWGDYSNAVVDPLNDLDMWTIQEHAAAVSGGYSRWSTWWGRILPPPPVQIQLGTVTAADGNTGDADVIIEPGESNNKLTVQLKNTGAAVNTVKATLTSLSTGVTIVSGAGTSTYPNLAASTGSGNNTTPFQFNVASTYPCGIPINFKLTVTYSGGVGSPAVITFTVPTGKVGAAVTKTRTGTAVAIPDDDNNTSTPPTSVNIPLAVSGFTGRISDLNFKFGGTTCTTATGATTVGLDHTWVGDLVVTLKSPQGTVVTLINRMDDGNNSGQNFCNTTLDDESAGASIQTAISSQAPFTGSFKPANPLSAFDGQNPNGTWTLNVSDRGQLDTGSVRTFSLIITAYGCSTTASASPLETERDRALAALLLPAQLSARPEARGQLLAALLDDGWATFGGPEAEALRAALLPRRYDHLARLLSG